VTAGPVYDVAVIGAGVVGTAIARELSGYQLAVALLESRADVGDGTSKANTALLHTGYDTTPGTLESRLVRRGYRLLGDYAARTGIPVERTGAILVAWNGEELEALPELLQKATDNGSDGCELVDATEVYRQLPHLGDGALGGLTIPGESIICTWTTSLAYAAEARRRGVQILLDHRVQEVEVTASHTTLRTSRGDVTARFVVNVAGLRADEVDELFGNRRFTVTPRRGELLVFDKLARPLVDRIVLPVPSRMGKGVLIAPTVYGNVMLGPTAEELIDKDATGTSQEGLALLLRRGQAILPKLVREEITATYAGLRAKIDSADFLIETDSSQRYTLVGGIRSTGLSASMAIAEHVRDQLADAGLELTERAELPSPPRMPNIGEAFSRPYQDGELIAADPSYGRIVCFCERVTEGEIRDAYSASIPPADLGGLRRRTRAMNGRCQGFFCGASVQALHDARGRISAAEALQSGESLATTRTRRASPGPAPAAPEPPVSVVRHTRRARETTTDVLIVGAGPAGLTAAAALAPQLDGEVLVLEREAAGGGIPRHCDHSGFGLRDLRTFTSGPAYARRLVAGALRAGARIRTHTMVTGWSGERTVEVTSPVGVERVSADAVILATGARERPRPARLVAGDRPAGVFTTGQLQNLVHLQHRSPGSRAVIVGAELVSWSAALTLRQAGCRPVLMTSEHHRPESYGALSIGGRFALRLELATRSRVARIIGHGRVEAVELEQIDTGVRRTVDCDTVIFTGDWIPDSELARGAGLQIDDGTRGPVIDTAQATSAPGLFAIGNLVHPADAADVAALDGRAVAGPVLCHLGASAQAVERDGSAQPELRPRILPGANLEWVTPGVLARGFSPPGGRLSCRPRHAIVLPTATVRQAGQPIARRRLPWPASPGRVYRIPASLLSHVDATATEVTVDLEGTRHLLGSRGPVRRPC
jgi:glycerol-3-phosphate dehydrogenase